MIQIAVAGNEKITGWGKQARILLKMGLPDEQIRIVQHDQQTFLLREDNGSGIPSTSQTKSTELDRFVKDNQIDVLIIPASLMPAAFNETLTLAATLKRQDPNEALISRNHLLFRELPQGSTVVVNRYTTMMQLNRQRHDLKYHHWKASLKEYLHLLQENKITGFISGAEYFIHEGLANHISEFLSPELCVPPVNQGIAVVLIPSKHTRFLQFLNKMDNKETRMLLFTELQFMQYLNNINDMIKSTCYAEMIHDDLVCHAVAFHVKKQKMYRLKEKINPLHAGEMTLKLAAQIGEMLK